MPLASVARIGCFLLLQFLKPARFGELLKSFRLPGGLPAILTGAIWGLNSLISRWNCSCRAVGRLLVKAFINSCLRLGTLKSVRLYSIAGLATITNFFNIAAVNCAKSQLNNVEASCGRNGWLCRSCWAEF